LLTLLVACAAHAQQQDPLRRPVVYTLPGAEQVVVERDLTYRTVEGVALKMDVYAPPNLKEGTRLPAVIFVNGVGDPPAGRPKLKEWGQYTSWGRLVAASGMVAVTYESRELEPYKDTESAIDYVRRNAAALKVDENKIGVWACSANVRIGLPLVMEGGHKFIRSAVFYYGPMDAPTMRQDIPLFVARAGFDNANLNNSIDEFMRQAVAEDVPATFVNYADGQHGFDLVDDNDKSREIVRQTLEFIKFNTSREVASGDAVRRAPSPARFRAMIEREGMRKALQAYEEAKKAEPGAFLFREQTVNGLGYQLLRAGKVKEAVEIFKLNVAAYPKSSNVYDSLSDGYEADGNKELAIQYAEKALEVLPGDSIPEQAKTGIRDAATQKLKRLKGQ
ncbi:MAG: hypothetical protein ACRD68_05550, partial [Pyrinomonadaceae bacterium]